MSKSNSFENGLKKYVPENALSEIVQHCKSENVRIRITKPRSSKLGDFRSALNMNEPHLISVNGNLNIYSFLFTFLHELAHLQTFTKYGRFVAPHGKEWKDTFRELLLQFLEIEAFHDSLIPIIRKHLINPKATSYSDLILVRALKNFDNKKPSIITLEEISIDAHFNWKNRLFQKKEKRRTRYKCEEISSGKEYLFHALCEVKSVI